MNYTPIAPSRPAIQTSDEQTDVCKHYEEAPKDEQASLPPKAKKLKEHAIACLEQLQNRKKAKLAAEV